MSQRLFLDKRLMLLTLRQASGNIGQVVKPIPQLVDSVLCFRVSVRQKQCDMADHKTRHLGPMMA
jgi:hypothetical protein